MRMLGTATTGCDSTVAGYCDDIGTLARPAACIDLSAALSDKYVVAIPQDPRYGSAAMTRYIVQTIAGNRVKVTACDLEGVTDTLSVSR